MEKVCVGTTACVKLDLCGPGSTGQVLTGLGAVWVRMDMRSGKERERAFRQFIGPKTSRASKSVKRRSPMWMGGLCDGVDMMVC